MTKEDLDTLERLHRAATAGEWRTDEYGIRDRGGYVVKIVWPTRFPNQNERYAQEVVERTSDAASIAANHNAMDYLLSVARREKVLREALEKARAGLSAIREIRTPARRAPDQLNAIDREVSMAAQTIDAALDTNERPHP